MRTILLALALAAPVAAFTTPSAFRSVVRRGMKLNSAVAEEIMAHGGPLVDCTPADKDAAAKSCTKEVQLNARQLCDVELIANGGFSPLKGFMNEEEYLSVVNDIKMPDGTLFSLPVVFDTDDEDIVPGDKLLLKQGDLSIATLTVETKYLASKPLECKACYGTSSVEHPGVVMVAMEKGKYYISGPVEGLNKPVRDFPCKTPREVREELPSGVDVVAFQCRNPVHRAHYELFTRALDADNVGEGGVVMVHPTCGPTQADDIDGTVRYKTYEVLKAETNNPKIIWNYLPYSMHMAGPREAIHHMMIRKNFGCTHFIIGRDMAGSKSSLDGEDFYGAYEAQEFAQAKSAELGVKCVPSLNLVYTEEEGYVTVNVAEEKGLTKKTLSGTKFRKALRAGEDIPEWFAFKSVVEVLRAPGNGIN